MAQVGTAGSGLSNYPGREVGDSSSFVVTAASVAATKASNLSGSPSASRAACPQVGCSFSRVSKARVLDAVIEAVNPEEAGRIAGFKKADMAEAAERLVEGEGWLPVPLRTVSDAAEPEDQDPEVSHDDDAYSVAAE
ncbi:hypothetical protein [Brevundimonas vesicularis]|uniref:hypothetical protein n=1 Tax=Brevundimonas vesicularis TaxID=41276 RepID=UPI00384C3557